MKTHLSPQKKLVLAIFFGVLFVLFAPQASSSLLPNPSFRVYAQEEKSFLDRILDPIRSFFSSQPTQSPAPLTGESRSCYACYNAKCSEYNSTADSCLGAAAEVWRREDLSFFSVGSPGEAIYRNWPSSPIVYKTRERKSVYDIPFDVCVSNTTIARPAWVSSARDYSYSTVERGGDVVFAGALVSWVNTSGYDVCGLSNFHIEMREPGNWVSEVNYVSGQINWAGGLKDIVFVIEGPNLSVHKFVSGQPGAGFNFGAEVESPSDGTVYVSNPSETTEADGMASFDVIYTTGQEMATISVSENPSAAQRSNYALVDAYCEKDDGSGTMVRVGATDLPNLRVNDITMGIDEKVECSFYNVTKTTIKVEKYVDGGRTTDWLITPTINEGGIAPATPQPTSETGPIVFMAAPNPSTATDTLVTLTENLNEQPGYEDISILCQYQNGTEAGTSGLDSNGNPQRVGIKIFDNPDSGQAAINCRFNNKRIPNEVRVEKYIDGGSGPVEGWEITASTTSGNISPPVGVTTSDPTSPLTFTVAPNFGQIATVTLAETTPPGSSYEPDSISCSYPNDAGNAPQFNVDIGNRRVAIEIPYFDLDPNHEVIYCRFNNKRIPNEVRVEKYIDGGSGPIGDWRVTPQITNGRVVPSDPQLTTPGPNEPLTFLAYPNVGQIARITLTEDLKPDFEFGSASCTYEGGGNVQGLAVGSSGVSFDISYGDPNFAGHKIITCRFDNIRRTEIVVEKFLAGEVPKTLQAGWTVYASSADCGVGPPSGLTTADSSNPLRFTAYPGDGGPHSVVLTEDLKDGYEVEELRCSYEGETTSFTTSTNTSIELQNLVHDGRRIFCEFYNKRATVIKVEKYIDGGANANAEWYIAPSITDGNLQPPHSQLTTSDPNAPLTYRVYPNAGKTASVTLTENLKRDYYEFDRIDCKYADGIEEVPITVGDFQAIVPVVHNDTNPNHTVINCQFYNKTIPSRISNLKLSFDYKDCERDPDVPEPEPEVIKIESANDGGTRVLRHSESVLSSAWLDWNFDDADSAGWVAAKAVWSVGSESVPAWVNTGFVPDGHSTPPQGTWYFMDTNGPRVVQSTNNAYQPPWSRDFIRKKFVIPSDRKVTLAKLYVASDNLLKVWLKESEGGAFSLVGEGNRLDNHRNEPGYNYGNEIYDQQTEGGIYERNIDLAPGDPEVAIPPGEYVLGVNLLNWRPFRGATDGYPGDPHPMGAQFLLYLETEPVPEYCNAQDDNGDCDARDPNNRSDSNGNGIFCDCIQNPDTHIVDCDEGVDTSEGWEYTLHHHEPAKMTFVRPLGVTGDIGTAAGLLIPTNSQTYEIEVNWGEIWRESLWGDFIQRNCNAQEDGSVNPNNSPFCHAYNVGFDFDLNLHGRRVSVKAMNPTGPGWVDIGECGPSPEPGAGPNTYSCNLNEILLTGDGVPDLHQDQVKIKFVLDAPCCEGSSRDGICPDLTVCATEECNILTDSDCCCNYDFNRDGIIDSLDYEAVVEKHGCAGGDSCYDPLYDINSDGVVDSLDDELLARGCHVERCGEPFSPFAPSGEGVLLPGDLDGDCKVTVRDIMMVAFIWNTKAGDARYNPDYNFDARDNRITVADIMYVAFKWNTKCP